MQRGKPLIAAMRFVLARVDGKVNMDMKISQKGRNKWYIIWSHKEKFGVHKRAVTQGHFTIGPFSIHEARAVYDHMQTAVRHQ